MLVGEPVVPSSVVVEDDGGVAVNELPPSPASSEEEGVAMVGGSLADGVGAALTALLSWCWPPGPARCPVVGAVRATATMSKKNGLDFITKN